ncbi:hypothetical protein [Rhodopseudomonas pseudopalustris]|uniref:Uncharacterized protein n=2 Tax=Rhodopseudomonas TaxID=1073 RepID=Q139Q4_RHOPS|nr:hypothetical protein [Rhodopseudomonas pseudopalustris]ABE39185.1 conserved hypothetical protein [Rhodopseudomonas palustris BisB5]SEO72788.1 hypothetical protein SAMN05444123_104227 [Rhodopseudomonas pseudopalustris]
MRTISKPALVRDDRVRLPVLLFALLGVTLGGCAGGDFGRTRGDFVTDDMHRWVGIEATGSVGARPSDFQLTDEERTLRDMAYPLIEPPRQRPAWKTVFGDYQPIAAPWRQAPPFDRTAYGKMLVDEPHRSHTSRYAALSEDIRNDLTRFEPFKFTAMRVIELDRKRNAALKYISDLSPRERADAIGRMEENALIVQWVQQCLHRRVASYRWGLERLVIMAPDTLAADADRLIVELEAQASNLSVPAGPARGHVLKVGG